MFVFPSFSFSLPNIITYPKNITNKQVFEINGENFSSCEITADVKFENFEGKTIGNKLDISTLNDPYGKYYYNSDAHSKDVSITTNTYSDPKANPSYIWFDMGKEVSEIYFTFWTKIQFIGADNYDLGGSQLKWYTIRSQPYKASSGWGAYPWFQEINGKIEWKYFGDAAVLGGVYSGGLLKYEEPTDATWFRVEIYGKRSSKPDTADGIWKIVHLQPYDGRVITVIEDNSYITHTEGDLGWRYALFVNTITNTETRAELNIWFDDMYVNTTRARVEIGNNQNWQDCTHREIQIPVKWNPRIRNAETIKFEVNQGSFSKGEKAYLFVVDVDGYHSDGKQITFY